MEHAIFTLLLGVLIWFGLHLVLKSLDRLHDKIDSLSDAVDLLTGKAIIDLAERKEKE